MKFRIFKLPQNKTFNYQPLYYDPEKEAKEERFKSILMEHDKKVDQEKGIDTRISSAYQNSRSHRQGGIGFTQLILASFLGMAAIFYLKDQPRIALWTLLVGVMTIFYVVRRRTNNKNR